MRHGTNRKALDVIRSVWSSSKRPILLFAKSRRFIWRCRQIFFRFKNTLEKKRKYVFRFNQGFNSALEYLKTTKIFKKSKKLRKTLDKVADPFYVNDLGALMFNYKLIQYMKIYKKHLILSKKQRNEMKYSGKPKFKADPDLLLMHLDLDPHSKVARGYKKLIPELKLRKKSNFLKV